MTTRPKMTYSKAALISLLGLFAPIQAVIFTVGVIIIGDLILGIWAAKKRGEAITSAAMRRTLTKMFVYQLAILTGFLIQVHLMDNLIPIAKLVASVAGMVEFKSLLENASEITGTNFKDIINKLGSKNDQ